MVSYRLDRGGFERHLLNAPWMEDHMKRLADGAKDVAEAIAPVYEDGPHPGRYKDSFHVESGTYGGAHHDRAYAVLSNYAPEALSVEFGTENNEAHHVLTHALDSIPGRQYKRAEGSNDPLGEL